MYRLTENKTSIKEVPQMKEPEFKGEKMSYTEYEKKIKAYNKHLSSLKEYDISGIAPSDWPLDLIPDVHFKLDYQINQEKYIPVWESVDEEEYNKYSNAGTFRRIVAIPLSSQCDHLPLMERNDKTLYCSDCGQSWTQEAWDKIHYKPIISSLQNNKMKEDFCNKCGKKYDDILGIGYCGECFEKTKKPSTTSPQKEPESQDELWDEIIREVYNENNRERFLEIIKNQFLITRK